MASVKMKVGRDAARDPERVRVAREAIGDDVDLLVDANGAWDEREALQWCERFAGHGVTYVEEPVSSDDLDGLRFVRERCPPAMKVAAGEYGYDLAYFEAMLGARAVDVQQADVTRCAGITEFLRAGALCQAHGIPLSAHCAPAVSVHACCAVQRVFPMEYFHDHVRIEALLFDGTLDPEGGVLRPDPSRPGHGLEIKRAEVERYAA
jgi:L-alanine-DL-glutamate epimerase-like enolase superfamily enzyme